MRFVITEEDSDLVQLFGHALRISALVGLVVLARWEWHNHAVRQHAHTRDSTSAETFIRKAERADTLPP